MKSSWFTRLGFAAMGYGVADLIAYAVQSKDRIPILYTWEWAIPLGIVSLAYGLYRDRSARRP